MRVYAQADKGRDIRPIVQGLNMSRAVEPTIDESEHVSSRLVSRQDFPCEAAGETGDIRMGAPPVQSQWGDYMDLADAEMEAKIDNIVVLEKLDAKARNAIDGKGFVTDLAAVVGSKRAPREQKERGASKRGRRRQEIDQKESPTLGSGSTLQNHRIGHRSKKSEQLLAASNSAMNSRAPSLGRPQAPTLPSLASLGIGVSLSTDTSHNVLPFGGQWARSPAPSAVASDDPRKSSFT